MVNFLEKVLFLINFVVRLPWMPWKSILYFFVLLKKVRFTPDISHKWTYIPKNHHTLACFFWKKTLERLNVSRRSFFIFLDSLTLRVPKRFKTLLCAEIWAVKVVLSKEISKETRKLFFVLGAGSERFGGLKLKNLLFS